MKEKGVCGVEMYGDIIPEGTLLPPEEPEQPEISPMEPSRKPAGPGTCDQELQAVG